jgi:hypothetical protein
LCEHGEDILFFKTLPGGAAIAIAIWNSLRRAQREGKRLAERNFGTTLNKDLKTSSGSLLKPKAV